MILIATACPTVRFSTVVVSVESAATKYCISFYRKDIIALERSQRKFMKILPKLENYNQREVARLELFQA